MPKFKNIWKKLWWCIRQATKEIMSRHSELVPGVDSNDDMVSIKEVYIMAILGNMK